MSKLDFASNEESWGSFLQFIRREETDNPYSVNPLIRPNNDPNQISHCNITGLSVREIMRIESMIT